MYMDALSGTWVVSMVSSPNSRHVPAVLHAKIVELDVADAPVGELIKLTYKSTHISAPTKHACGIVFPLQCIAPQCLRMSDEVCIVGQWPAFDIYICEPTFHPRTGSQASTQHQPSTCGPPSAKIPCTGSTSSLNSFSARIIPACRNSVIASTFICKTSASPIRDRPLIDSIASAQLSAAKSSVGVKCWLQKAQSVWLRTGSFVCR